MNTVVGTFDVTMHPEPPFVDGDGVVLARATFDKTFFGPLSATSHAQFLSVRAGTNAAYVALERIEGTLAGRQGSFVVTHKAFQSPSEKNLLVEIVPGTGTGELAGISGSIAIEIRDGKHHYSLRYALPESS